MTEASICIWDKYPKDPFPFCEEQLCQFVGQPANTWSNIGYFIAAWMVWRNRDLGANRYAFAGVGLFLAVGSTLFHMSGSMWAKVLDVGAMLLLSGVCLVLSLNRGHGLTRSYQIGLLIVLSALSYPLIQLGKWGGYVFVFEIVVISLLELRIRLRVSAEARKLLHQVLITFPLALGLNMMDQHGPLCWPTNHVFTVHGLWHLMTAFCIYRIAEYYGRPISSI